MHRLLINTATLAVGVLLSAACATQRVLPLLDITVTPLRFHQATNFQDQIKTFEFLQAQEEYHQLKTEDMKDLLWALHYQEVGDLRKSLEYWMKILSDDHPSLQNKAFASWVTTLDQIMGQKKEIAAIAAFFWQEPQLQQSKFAKRHGWTEEQNILPKIAAILDVKNNLAANEGNMPEDPFLAIKAAQYCENPDDSRWSTYLEGLPESLLGYWQALILDCKGQPTLALEKFEAIYKDLSTGQDYLSYAYYASKAMIRLQKYVGNREATADAYKRTLELIYRNDFQPSHLNEDKDFPLFYERLNIKLWTARYNALVGNYKEASTLVQEALASVKGQNLKDYSRKEVRSITELMAEAYHISAFRISLEQQEYDISAMNSELGAQLDPLSENWKWRFQWYKGWYRYLQGMVKQAQDSWLELVEDDIASVWREKALFWLAFTMKNLQKQKAFEIYRDRLYRDFPFGFYTIYSGLKLGWAQSNDFKAENFQHKLSQWNLDIAPLMADEDLKMLHQRILFALKLGNSTIIKEEILSLYRLSRKRISTNHLETYLYISRLLLVGHQYPLAMGLSFELSQRFEDLWETYPEQILVSFPNAYFHEVKAVAQDNNLDPYLLLGLIRQESAFDREATSWIGAKGLLQLMPHTAAKYLQEFPMNEEALTSSLEEPLFNLQLAGKHLSYLQQHYKGDLFKVCAAYNAGEYVVDRWITRRRGENELVWLENIPFSETQKYVKFVIRNRIVYQKIYDLEDSHTIKAPQGEI